MLKTALIVTLFILFPTSVAFADIEVDEQYYYNLGEVFTINGQLLGYDNFLFKSNGITQESVKITIHNTQSPEQVFNITVTPTCVNGDYPDCDYTFSNSLSLSREVGFTEGVYNVDVSYGDDNTSYEFGIGVHSVEALMSMSFENKDGQQISISLDKDGYKVGDTVNITAFTNFGSKQVLTASVEQIDSPVFSPTRYGSYDTSLDHNQYDNTFTTSIQIDESEKRLGHYKITVFDNLDNTVKYFIVSKSGFVIIPDNPTLVFESQYLRYGDTLHLDGYMNNMFDVRYDLSEGSYDNKRQSDDLKLVGNNVVIELEYESEDFKQINSIYSNMNEVGYFSHEIEMTRNIPHSEIITVTVSTNSESITNQFIILPDESNRLTYYDDVHDCDAQVEYLKTHMQYELTDDCR